MQRLDIYNSSDSFRAKNEEGYSLYVYYDDDDKEYSISLHEPEKETTNEPTETNENKTKDNKIFIKLFFINTFLFLKFLFVIIIGKN